MDIYTEWTDGYTGNTRSRIYRKIDPNSITLSKDELSFSHLQEEPNDNNTISHTLNLNLADLYLTTDLTITQKAVEIAKTEGHRVEKFVIDMPRSAIYDENDFLGNQE